MYKVRFHLGAGINYLKWQVSIGNTVKYYDPNKVMLAMFGCELKNRPNIAQKIFDGAKKDVCAWVNCELVRVLLPTETNGKPVLYNPRKKPFWTNENGENLDGHKFGILLSNGKTLLRL